MALQEDELAAKGFGETVDAVRRRACQDVIAGAFKVAPQQPIISRVRNETDALLLAREWMILLSRESEHAVAFLWQQLSFDAVEMQDRDMGRKTRENCRGGVLLRPVDEFSQFLPVILIAQASRARLRPGNDETVQVALHRRARGLVARANILQCLGRARRSLQSEQAEFDVDIASGRANQAAELAFRYFQRLVAHIVDQTNSNGSASYIPSFSGEAESLGEGCVLA